MFSSLENKVVLINISTAMTFLFLVLLSLFFISRYIVSGVSS